MIRLNYNEIKVELSKDIDRVNAESADFLRECYLEGLAIAIEETPVGEHGDLRAAWKINIGDEPDLYTPNKRGEHRPGGGINAARSTLAKLKIGDRVWLTNTDFKATWFEYGLPLKTQLGPTIGARRMAEKAVAYINGKVSR